MNIFTYYKKGNRVYVALTNQPTNDLLIDLPKKELYDFVSKNYEKMLKQFLVGDSQVVSRCFSMLNSRSKTALLSINNTLPTNKINKYNVKKLKSSENRGEKSFIEYTNQKLVGKISRSPEILQISGEEIEKTMVEKPAYKWHYTEIAKKLGIDAETLRKKLENIVASPNNNTRIRKSGDEGYYVLRDIDFEDSDIDWDNLEIDLGV